jgi:transcriptional regulator with XRE-family HTH domain
MTFDGDDTAQSLADSFGQIVRTTRTRLRRTQASVGTAVGISQSAVSLIERGRLLGVNLQVIADLCDALDIQPRWDLRPPWIPTSRAGLSPTAQTRSPSSEGESASRQHDRAHACCSAFVRRRLERNNWDVAQEVEIVLGRSHGWIDILAFNERSRVLLVGEIKTELHDLGEIQRTMGWYAGESGSSARRLGWEARVVVRCLLVLATGDNDARIAANRELLRQAFPARSRRVARIVADPSSATATAGLVMFDPRARRRQWIQGVTADGRRAVAPYLDYRDFVAQLDARRRVGLMTRPDRERG